MRENVIKAIEENKIIAIIRGISPEDAVEVAKALYEGGVKLVEVTFNQSAPEKLVDTAIAIKSIKDALGDKVLVGAGTVLNKKQVDMAFNAGAEYIISPDCYREVIEKTRELGMVSLPGAITPTEAANAHRWGADFVKLFPNSEFKPSYLKALAAPLSHIKFLAVGGVNADNLKEYMAAGAVGIGVATAIASKDLIKKGDAEGITALARKFTSQL
jgi:2-dehydro-3-deoxyphosphogluconate aldolase/(4S)-4-hydroxy-2-oxoglutarate aldolase